MSYVNVHYGPYEACGVVRHRTQRLRGLKERLEQKGHTVELIPSPHWDRCDIEVARRNIFHCRLTHFEYYTDGRDDVICDRAMAAVRDAIRRVKPSFLYPDIPLFSVEFFEEAIGEAFRLLNVREFIVECLEKAYAYSSVVECIDTAIDEAMKGEYVRFLLGEMIETTLQNDYMRDLVDSNLEKVFELHDFMADTIIDAVETRDFMKETIMAAITRTHPMIKEFIKTSIETAFRNACSQLGLRGGSFEDLIKSSVGEGISTAEHVGIKQILEELVDELSLRSRESERSMSKEDSDDVRKRSEDSDDVRRHSEDSDYVRRRSEDSDYVQRRSDDSADYDDGSKRSLELDRSNSSRSN